MKISCIVAFLAVFAGCHSPRVELAMLDSSAEPLQTRFNAEKDRPRVLALFSPV